MRTQRRSPRQPTTYDAQLAQRDRRHAVEIADISRHGARVHGAGASRVGDHVTLEVAGSGRNYAVPGTVIWNDRGRRRSIGIEFVVTSEAQARTLDGLLAELFKAQPGTSKGDVLVMVDDAAASRALEEAVRHAGFAPIARTTAAEVIKHLCRAPEASVVAAFVSSELPERGQQHAFTYLAEQWPSARRIVVERGVSSLDVAAALHGAGRYG